MTARSPPRLPPLNTAREERPDTTAGASDRPRSLIPAFSPRRLEQDSSSRIVSTPRFPTQGGGRLSTADDFYSGWLRNAEAHIKKRQYGAAIVEYTKALKLKPRSKSCLLARARCHMILGEVPRALADAERTVEDDHDYLPGLVALAEIYFVMGKLNQSRLYYARGHKLRPNSKVFLDGIKRVEDRVRELVENPGSSQSQDWGASASSTLGKPPCIVRTPLYDSTSAPRFGIRAT